MCYQHVRVGDQEQLRRGNLQSSRARPVLPRRVMLPTCLPQPWHLPASTMAS